ncbi:hypothetical protein P154DRAFT_547761 [Amniculicola lignicola CBS 123094]|uniref:Uncharacterized protein n=1 Tax=Amniculicola lignicola CBS 123094 TaxID=1392246 RepID=A0A6A5W4G7_9PLEO|nr:hypothetical protein P154DRAFT_547761 [Amniculicola lignicola CBS 123094]
MEGASGENRLAYFISGTVVTQNVTTRTNSTANISTLTQATVKMGSINNPKRVVLRFSIQYEREEAAINEQLFALHGPELPNKDFFSHLIAPNESSKMHIVLDIHCNSHPTIDSSMISYEVFKVKTNGNFNFEKLDTVACEYARKRCELFTIKWCTNRSLI